MHTCKIFITFEVVDNQSNIYVPMCKGNTNFPNTQAQTDFLNLFEVEKKVEMSFSAPELSSLGGLSLLTKSARNSNFLTRLSGLINDWRNPSFTVHTMADLVKQRVLQIAAGYEDADDCDLLRHDAMLKLAVGHTPEDRDLCSQPTMTRLENHVSHKELWDIGNLFVNHFISSYKEEPTRIILDIDDSNSNAYGAQQLTLFNNYYGEYCYMPLFIFEAQSQRLVLPLLRPGRVSKQANVCGLLKRLIEKLREQWKHTEIIIRGDAMFSGHEFMEWAMTQPRLHYIFGYKAYKPLQRLVEDWKQDVMQRYKENPEDIKEYHALEYAASNWKCKQWTVVKIEHTEQGCQTRFIVTDMKEKTAKRLYEKDYCKRADCELCIKEMKDGLRADRMSCNKFSANQFRLFLHAAAYVILLDAKQKLFRKTEMANVTIQTFREKLILMPVKITELKTKIKLEYQRDNPMRYKFRRALVFM